MLRWCKDRCIIDVAVLLRPLQGGWTALHVAVFFNRADVVGALLDDARLDAARSTGVRLCLVTSCLNHVVFLRFAASSSTVRVAPRPS